MIGGVLDHVCRGSIRVVDNWPELRTVQSLDELKAVLEKGCMT